MSEQVREVPVQQGSVSGIVQAFGVPVRVRVSGDQGASPETLASLMQRLLSAWSESPVTHEPSDDALDVDLGVVTEQNFERVHSTMSTRVTLAALEHHAGTSLMFHAGGIARDDGSVAVIVGPSGRGKTTTMRHLARDYGYVSDETVTIAPDGAVLPYRKPLSVITEGHTHKLQVSPSELGLQPLPSAPLTVGALALLERAEAGVDESSVQPVPLGAGIVGLVEQSSYLMDLDRPLCRIAELAVQVGGIKQLTVGAPERITEVAAQLFIPGDAPRWEQVVPAAIADRRHERPAAFVPGEVFDAIECEDGTVVFAKNRQSMLLDGVGPVIWRAACEGDDWPALITRVEEAFGPAPGGDTRDAILTAAAQLVEAGVLLHGSTPDAEPSNG